jgi:hypothetical protein
MRKLMLNSDFLRDKEEIKSKLNLLEDYTCFREHYSPKEKRTIINLFKQYSDCDADEYFDEKEDVIYVFRETLYNTSNTTFPDFICQDFKFWLNLFYKEISYIQEIVDNSDSTKNTKLDQQLKKLEHV